MTWINIIDIDKATGRLKTLLERVKGPDGKVDNILLSHSLRPHTLEGHMALYKHVLHNSANSLPKWFAEAIGVYVSALNNCTYCVVHHAEGLKRDLKDDERSAVIIEALTNDKPDLAFHDKELMALTYARMLTKIPHTVGEAQIDSLRKSGWDDGDILEINQITAYFAYANRTVLGLGVNTDGDTLGLSPNDGADPDNWGHS